MAEGPATDDERSDPADDVRRSDESRPSLPAPKPNESVPMLGPPTARIDEGASRAREPTVDVVVTPSRIYVTVDIPGASKETIDVQATDHALELHASGVGGREYATRIELTVPVNPDVVQATYANDVLDVTLLRRQGHMIRVRRGDRDE